MGGTSRKNKARNQVGEDSFGAPWFKNQKKRERKRQKIAKQSRKANRRKK